MLVDAFDGKPMKPMVQLMSKYATTYCNNAASLLCLCVRM